MTVAELIAKLQTYPPDAVVIYDYCSDYAEMEHEDVTLYLADEQLICWRSQNGYMGYRAAWFQGETPDFRTVVHFPGT